MTKISADEYFLCVGYMWYLQRVYGFLTSFAVVLELNWWSDIYYYMYFMWL